MIIITFYGVWKLVSQQPLTSGPLGKTTLAATEFVRLLEASGSVTAKQSNKTSEKRHKLFQRRV